jgi:polyphosphate kinase 2 (PPK2 family)
MSNNLLLKEVGPGEELPGFDIDDPEKTPLFEAGLVRDGIILIKPWPTVDREMQLKRSHARRHHPLKHWKLTDVDIMGVTK